MLEDIIKHYGLCEKAVDGYVYMKIRKGMYRLPQAGVLANKLLKLHLAHHGYFKQPHMPGLWKYVSQPIWFKLCMDDFGIKYIGDKQLKHLFAALWMETYDNVKDWTVNLYCGISLAWNYNRRYVDIAIHAYIRCQTVTLVQTSSTYKAATLSLQSKSNQIWAGKSSY